MTGEERNLLLIDLCARLPYNVQCRGYYTEEASYTNSFGSTEEIIDTVEGIEHIGFDNDEIYVVIGGIPCELSEVRPYLRPMSSMTEEEAMEYANCGNIIAKSPQNNYLIPNPNCVDWLNAHHFDYRGLISMGLAIEVTEENNPIVKV